MSVRILQGDVGIRSDGRRYKVQHRAWEAAFVLHDHALPPVARAHVCLVRGMHPENLGWLSVVRMFVLYRDVLGERV